MATRTYLLLLYTKNGAVVFFVVTSASFWPSSLGVRPSFQSRRSSPTQKCKLGSLNIQAGSRHIYENDFKKLDTIFNSNYHDESEISFNSLIEKYKDSPKKFISNLREAADHIPVSKDKGILQKIDFIKHG